MRDSARRTSMVQGSCPDLPIFSIYDVWDIDAPQPTAPRLSLPTSGSANPVFLSDDRRWLVCCDGASAFIWDLHASQSQDFAYKCDVTLAVDSRVKVASFHDRWLVLTTGRVFSAWKERRRVGSVEGSRGTTSCEAGHCDRT